MVRGSLQNVGTILIEGFYRFKFTYEDFLNIRKFSFDAPKIFLGDRIHALDDCPSFVDA